MPISGQRSARTRMPEVNAEAMDHHLKAIGAGVAPGPMENVWHYLRENILCSRVWDTYDDIIEACSIAWRFANLLEWGSVHVECQRALCEGDTIDAALTANDLFDRPA